MNVLSLFDGMSCGRLALERAGVKVDNYFASEVDRYAIQTARALYPDTIQLGGIQEVKAADLPKIQLLCGGSQCQGFSRAGKGGKFDDPRSTLFWEFKRLLDECKPDYFLLENVRMDKYSEGVISDALGLDPVVINSTLVSAQNRVRLYWSNIRTVKHTMFGHLKTDMPQPEDRGVLLRDVLETPGVTPDKSQCIQATIYKENPKSMLQRGKMGLLVNENIHWRKLTPRECGRLQTVPEWAIDRMLETVSDTQAYKMLGNGFTVEVIAHIFSFLPDEFKQKEEANGSEARIRAKANQARQSGTDRRADNRP